jgi:mRNA-degrading endonuclease RelE of RelBE toxin-antitoxin system
MTDRINYCETPEFQKDFKRLAKKYRTLDEDFALAKKATIELYHLQKINNNAVFPIPEYCREPIEVLKLNKFACKSLFGKGVKSGIRIIYAFNSVSYKVDFIEIYYKGEQENEDRDRIRNYLKGGL